MAQDRNNPPRYSMVGGLEHHPEVSATNNGGSSSSSSICIYVLLISGVLSGIIFIAGAVFFGQHCAQVLANEEKGTVYWSPQLAGMVAFIGLMSQLCLVSIPFRICLRRPILRRYANVGVITAKVIKREMHRTEKGKRYFKVVFAYYPDRNDRSSVYAKKIELGVEEGMKTEFPIRVLPDIPTSAILEGEYDDEARLFSGRNVKFGIISLMAPILWILAVRYTVDMQVYSTSDFWIRWGLGVLFGVGCFNSLCVGYLVVTTGNKKMLYGGASPISLSLLPPGFLEGLDNEEQDNAEPISSSLELV